MSTAWTFGTGGEYTAIWDGVSNVTVTVTSGGAFVESFAAQSLTEALSVANNFLTMTGLPNYLMDESGGFLS